MKDFLFDLYDNFQVPSIFPFIIVLPYLGPAEKLKFYLEDLGEVVCL